MNDINSLSHTSWNCKYHIVFAPKYRRKVFYGQKRKEIGKILRKLCEWKKVNIIEAEVCPDHIHMLVEIPPKYSVSSFMRYLKGKSTMYNFCQMITQSVAIQKGKRKYSYKVSFSDAVHICMQFFRSKIGPPAVEALLMRVISPIRPGRTDSRKLSQKPAVSFTYRVA